MNILSDYLMRSIIEEKHRDAMQLGQRERPVAANHLSKKDIFSLLKDLTGYLCNRQFRLNTLEGSEQNLNLIEAFDMSTSDVKNRLENRNQYERIVQGQALVEVETLSQKLWEAS